MKLNVLAITAILFLVFIIYFGVWNFDFAYDDFGHLVNNPKVA